MSAGPWYLEPDFYSPLLPKFGLSEADYLAAMGEIAAVFPANWAKRYAERDAAQGVEPSYPLALHPRPLGSLHTHLTHPLPYLLSGRTPTVYDLRELIRLGRDLHITKGITRITSLRGDLRDKDQYIGRLFELELLAEFVRARLTPEIVGGPERKRPDFRVSVDGRDVYVEARHRGVARAQEIWDYVRLGLFGKEFGRLTITVEEMGDVAKPKEEADKIVEDVNSIIAVERGDVTPVERRTYRIEHEPDGGPRQVRFRWGKETYELDLRTRITSALEEKRKQLETIESIKNGISIGLVAIDVRSLILPRVSDEKRTAYRDAMEARYFPNLSAWREAMVSAMQAFVRASNSASAVLAWWASDRDVLPTDNYDLSTSPYHQSIVTGEAEHPIGDHAALHRVLKALQPRHTSPTGT